jgi:hypothetical protein
VPPQCPATPAAGPLLHNQQAPLISLAHFSCLMSQVAVSREIHT